MRKIKLDVDSLVVESFAAADEGTDALGTVRGNGEYDVVTVRLTCFTLCGQGTCQETGSPCVAC
jgi:hypothetical protein